MSVSLATSRLWWKESRQVLPLWVAVPCLTIVLAIITMLVEDRFELASIGFFTLLPPILFSVGAGAVLVGKEKETRTLQWLSSLPIATRRLVVAKAATALAGLALLWMFSGLLLVLLRSVDPRVMNGQPIAGAPISDALVLYLALNSLYLLLCGFATAWYLRSAFVSLLAILPLAVLPTVTAQAWMVFANGFRAPGYRTTDAPMWLSFTTLCIGIAATGPLAYHLAIRSLRGPKPTVGGPWGWNGFVKRAWLKIASRFAGDSLTQSTPLTRFNSLRWQFRSQNRGIIFGLYAVFVVCLPVAWEQFVLLQLGSSSGRYIDHIAAMIVFCVVSWMAVLTFQGDNVDNRIRFLAERGISPSQVWSSRHVAPLIFLAFASALSVVLLTCVLASPTVRNESLPPWWAIFVGFGVTYSLSQWIGQQFHRLPLALVIAPVASYQAIVSAIYLVEEWGAPLLFIIVGLIVMPMTATYLMMRRWMDRRTGLDYQGRHVAMMSLALVLAYGTSGVPNLFEPKMSDELRRELVAEAARLEPSQHLAIDLKFVPLPRFEPVVEDAASPTPDSHERDMSMKSPQADGDSMGTAMGNVSTDFADSPTMEKESMGSSGLDMSMSMSTLDPTMGSEMVPVEGLPMDTDATQTNESDMSMGRVEPTMDSTMESELGVAEMSMTVEMPVQAPILDEAEWLDFQHQKMMGAFEVGQPIRSADVARLIAVTTKIRMQLDYEDSSGDHARTLSQYRDWMSLLVRIVAGLRLSPDWISQELADWLEIFLLAELGRANTAERLGDQLLTEIVQQTGDSDARWQARRRSLILSWRAGSLGGLNATSALSEPLRQYERRARLRQADRLVAALLEYIEEAKAGRGELPVQSLVAFWQVNPETYGAPPGGAYFRIDDVSKFALPPDTVPLVLASQWGAGWEQAGRQWKQKVKGGRR